MGLPPDVLLGKTEVFIHLFQKVVGFALRRVPNPLSSGTFLKVFGSIGRS